MSTNIFTILSLLIAVATFSVKAADPIWTSFVDYDCNLNNNQALYTMTGSALDCQNSCVANTQCNGFDYNRNTMTCSMMTQTCAVGGTYAYTYGITYYSVQRIAAPSTSGAVSISCTTSTYDYYGSSITSFICPANCASVYGSIWGTTIYSHDSSVCRAAIHAGVLNNALGGVVSLSWLPGQSSYDSTTANGITTSSWGAWYASYTFTSYTPQFSCHDINL
eukprot:PhF_6_TR12944/c1_g2_i2/m.20429